MRKKRGVKTPADRNIATAPIKDFKLPAKEGFKPLPKNDESLIRALSAQLKVTGVIDRESACRETQTLEELAEIITEANNLQKYEKDNNPEQHEQGLEDYLIESEKLDSRSWENPGLDGIDDYGNVVYDRFID